MRPVAFLLLVPALLSLLVSYLYPLVWTFRTSFQSNRGFGRRSFNGTANYVNIFEHGYAATIVDALVLALLPLLGVLVVAPLLAVAAHRAGRAGRRAVLAGLALPAAVFTPVGLAIGWRTDRVTGRPVEAIETVLAYGLPVSATATVLATLLYLAVLRRSDPRQPPWRALRVVATLAATAVLAAALQSYAVPWIVSSNPGLRGFRTPMVDLVARGFRMLDFGGGSAAGVVLFVALALLGVFATIMIIGTGLRLEFGPSHDPGPGRGGGAGLAGAVSLLILVVAVGCYAAWPWARRSFDLSAQADSADSVAAVLARTWLPALLAVLGVAVAALAGYAIGALRPLGRRSDLLLLPFAPFLFVGVGPFLVCLYDSHRSWGAVVEILNSGRLLVPVLYLFMLFAKGQAAIADRARSAGRPLPWSRVYGVPGGLLAGFLSVAAWLVEAQDVLPPYVMSPRPHENALIATVVDFNGYGAGGDPPLGLALPGWLALIFVASAGAGLLLVADRLSLRTVRDEPGPGPDDAPLPADAFPFPGQPFPGMPRPAPPFPAGE